MRRPAGTNWPAVLALVFAGIASAAQIGKVPAAMTTIGAEFGLGLSGAALLVSLFAVMAALGGLAIGLATSRIGARRALLGGMALGVIAAIGAAAAPGTPTLLLARLVEGAGFLLLSVAAPGLIAAAATGRDRSFAMGLWGTYMPLGIALGLVTAPLVEAAGWRVAWLATAALLALAALLCWRLVPAAAPVAHGAAPRIGAQLRALVAARDPLLVAAAFAAYNIIYIGIAAFLPARLEALGAGTGPAGAAAALAALANAGGNLACGLLMRRGIAPQALIARGVLAMSGCAAVVYLMPLAFPALGFAVLACIFGGVVPAASFALLPRVAPSPSLVAPAVGLTIQGNNLMQMLAPPALGALATLSWGWLALPMLIAGVLAALAGRAITR